MRRCAYVCVILSSLACSSKGTNSSSDALLTPDSSQPADGPHPIADITFRGASTAVFEGATSFTLAAPQAAPGDLLIAALGVGESSVTASVVVNAPSGWTEVRQTGHSTVGLHAVYWHVYAAGESEYTWSLSTGQSKLWGTGAIVAYSGVDTARPIDVEGGQDLPAGGTSLVTPTITTSAGKEMLVASFSAFAPVAVTFTPSEGLIERADVNNGDSRSVGLFDGLQAAAGASGAKTVTTSAACEWGIAHLLALRPGITAPRLDRGIQPDSKWNTDKGGCGDGTCSADESCGSCPSDCGGCPPTCGTGCNRYWVSPTGSDSNGDGSSAKPWATISYAASHLTVGSAGAEVRVLPGTYQQNVTTSGSGTAGAQVAFVSDTQFGAKIVGSGDSVWLNTGAYVTIEGFDITSSNASTRIGIVSYGQHARILNNKVHDIQAVGSGSMGAAGITPNNNGSINADYTTLDGNFVYNIAVSLRPSVHAHGIYVNGTKYVTVSNNLIVNTAGWGIVQDHPGVERMTAVNNTIVNCDAGIMVGNTSGGAPSDYNYVANNIVVHNTSNYAYEDCCSATNVGSHNTWTNNLDWDTTGGAYRLYYGSPQNRITADPQFASNTLDANGDYHILPGSPARNVGTSTSAPDHDFGGGARPADGVWDVGAYEQGSGAGNWPWQ